MANILQAKVSIEGTRTLAIHHFGVDALPLEAKEKDGVAGNSPNEWKKTVLMDEERQLFLLPTYFFGCIKYGGKTVKRGKGNLLADIASTLQVMDDQIYICNSDGPRRNWRFDYGAVIHEETIQRPVNKNIKKPRIRLFGNKTWSELTGKVWDDDQRCWIPWFRTKDELDDHLARQRKE
ncbi:MULTISPECIES: hypothetical protein [unclassified Nostoc]|uniref:hypothetical protein n=1 Tax=unclassified Nostoc TaxID=2593658 RepID=UPI001F5570CD|nr:MULTISPECIES: hypothetical protein [unclassified Nostoc]